MRKTIAVLLVAGFAAAMGGRALAADRAGIGLNWGVGPTLMLVGGFSMKMDEQVSLDWNVSDDFAVSVFSGNGTWRGSKDYTNNASPAITHKLTAEGETDVMGLAIIHSLPVLSFVKIGLELGIVTINELNFIYSNSDGTDGAASQFEAAGGSARDSLDCVSSMEGILAKVTLLKAESKGTYADLSVMGSLRFVQIPTLFVFGRQESDRTTVKGIDPIGNFNNLSLKVIASLGF